jgi:hypothetical protein
MDLQQQGDPGGGRVGGVEQEHLGTATLPGQQRFLQAAMDAAEFRRGRFPHGRGAGHG